MNEIIRGEGGGRRACGTDVDENLI